MQNYWMSNVELWLLCLKRKIIINGRKYDIIQRKVLNVIYNKKTRRKTNIGYQLNI